MIETGETCREKHNASRKEGSTWAKREIQGEESDRKRKNVRENKNGERKKESKGERKRERENEMEEGRGDGERRGR